MYKIYHFLYSDDSQIFNTQKDFFFTIYLALEKVILKVAYCSKIEEILRDYPNGPSIFFLSLLLLEQLYIKPELLLVPGENR